MKIYIQIYWLKPLIYFVNLSLFNDWVNKDKFFPTRFVKFAYVLTIYVILICSFKKINIAQSHALRTNINLIGWI